MCKFLAPNNEPSKVFDTISRNYGIAEAIVNYNMINGTEFKNWYDGETDANGEPVIKDRGFRNSIGEVRPLITDMVYDENITEAYNQSKRLADIFESRGIELTVTYDNNIASTSYVVADKDGNINVNINFNKIKKDSVFHEFGHVYVDLIGENDPLIQEGILQLRGSDLWRKIENLYPELDGIALGKEVLTTAIGIEAQKQYDLNNRIDRLNSGRLIDKISRLGLILQRIFRRVGEILGIQKNVATRLAYDLTGGKLRHNLTGKVSTYKQRQKFTIERIIEDSKKVKLSADEQFYITPSGAELNRVTSGVELLAGAFDRETAIRRTVASNSPLYRFYETTDEVERLWADKREEGTGIHQLFEDYITFTNQGISREKVIAAILEEPPKPYNSGHRDENGIRIYSGMKKNNLIKYITTVADIVDDIRNQGYTLHPEIKVWDEGMEFAGTIDLLAMKDGKATIFDFKTKEVVESDGERHTKFDEWNTINNSKPKMMGFAKEVDNTIANKYALQLSFYKLMLKRKGIEVEAMHIIPLIGKIEEQNGEYHYVSLEQYTGTNATAFNGKTFQVADHSGLIEEALFGKKDLTTQIEEASNAQEETESYLKTIGEITSVKDWLREVVIDLEKSISRIKRTASKEKGLKYENAIRDLIKRLLVSDEVEAIANYTDYVAKTTMQLHQKLNGRVVVTGRDAKGNVSSAELREGYAAMTWNDIKELENSNPEGYMEFLAFLINAEHFVTQIAKIREIEFSKALEHSDLSEEELAMLNKMVHGTAGKIDKAKTNEERNKLYYAFVEQINGKVSNVLQILKSYEGRVSDIEAALKRLNRELDMRYPEISTNPLFNQGDLSTANKLFFEAQADETFMQRHTDALADTHHTYIANVVKMYNQTMDRYLFEMQKIIAEWDDNVAKIGKENVIKVVDQTNGKFLSQIDYDRFYESLRETQADSTAKFKYGTNKYWKAMNAWYEKNTISLTAEEVKALDEKMLAKLGKTDFKTWKDKQYYEDINENKVRKRSGAYYKPNPSIYTDQRYEALSETEKEFLDYARSLTSYLVEHTKTEFFENGYIPAVPKDQRTVLEQLKASIGWRDSKHVNMTDEVIVDENGDIVNFLPFNFARKLGEQIPYEKVPDGASPDVIREIAQNNAEIRKENEKIHAAATNLDLNQTMQLFVDMALKHKYKRSIEFELWRVKKSMVDNHKVKVTKNGRDLYDKVKVMLSAKPTLEKSTQDSKILAHYEDWMRMIFYEDFEIDEGEWTKLARVLQNYTSFKGMALNPFSAINNQVYGELMSRIEGWANDHFSRKDWFNAGKIYAGSIASYFADRDATSRFSSKASAFMDKFYIMMDYRELAAGTTEQTLSGKAISKLGWAASKAYALQHLSEHNLQNRLLITMALSHRIVDGKIMNFADYKRGKIETYDPYDENKEKVAKFAKENKEIEKRLKEEFEKYKTVWDNYELVDGRLVASTELETNEMTAFKQRALGTNQYLHGIYNREDASAMQQYAIGRLAIQFRKWMRPGWNKRWGARAFESYWNERRANEEEGYYWTTIKFLGSPVMREFNKRSNDPEYAEQATTLLALKNIIQDYGRFITNVKIHWHSLSNSEQANVVRTMLEWAYLGLFVGALYLLKYIKGEDDDPASSLMLAIYQLDRSVTELTTYVPLAMVPGYVGGGWMNETKKILKSPTATFSSLESIFSLTKTIMMYPWWDEEERTYSGGVYSGDDKLKVQLGKMIPVYNQIARWSHLEKNYKYYKLF